MDRLRDHSNVPNFSSTDLIDSNKHFHPLYIASEDPTLAEFFESTVERYPHAKAVISEEHYLTYSELDEMSNQLANLLHQRGIGPSDFVGIFLDRSIRPIIAILAVLKSGAAYIPLDPSYPEERIKYILDETHMALVISEKDLASSRDEISCPIVLLDDLKFLNQYSKKRLSRIQTGASEQDLSYVLFTSGTTGRPKGIMTEHRNVVRFARSFDKIIKLNCSDRIYQGFSLGFDGSVEEMWMAFSNGAALVVGNAVSARLPDEAVRIMNELGVTVFSSVPTFLGLVKTDIPSLRLVILSGEKCPESLVNIWATAKRRVLNVYGPTETTVNTTAKECFPGEEITIGHPLEGYDIYVLNEKLKPVKQGEYGELYVGGVGVARGYYNRKDLTEKAFIDNPFYRKGLGGSKKIYKTGDKVSLLENGELQFFGRLDTQVKIRGFRVELSEIEAVLSESRLVKSALVHAAERSGSHSELAAYVIPDCKKEDFDYQEVLSLLKARLPHYMIPSYLDLLHDFPMLASGKANRRDLPTPVRPLISENQNIKPPTNDLEQKMVNAWKEIFQLEAISTEADFFVDLSGYSLLAVEMVALLRSEYEINISVREVYQYKTIEKIARRIEEIKSNEIENDAPKTEEKPRMSAKEVFEATPKWIRHICTLSQIAFSVFFTFYNTLYLGGIWFVSEVYSGNFAPSTLVYVLIFYVLFAYPLHILVSVLLKRLIVGKYKPGKHPLWGFYYLRWWMASRIEAATMVGGLTGTPLYNVYLRLMGAKIGRGSVINTGNLGSLDLLEVGENTSIGVGTHISGSRVEDGMLIIGSAQIGNNCFVGDSCCLALNTKMADNSKLEDLSLLPDNAETVEGASYVGSPAAAGDIPLPNVESENTNNRPVLYSILHLLALEALGLVYLLMALPVIAILFAGFYYGGIYGLVGAALFDALFGVVIFCFGIALAKKILMPQTPTGIFKVQSLFYVRKWMVDKLFSSSVVVLHSLYTTIFLPSWLRLMGAKIGKLAEISTVSKMTPDLTTIGDGSFFADGSMIGGVRLYKGHISLEKNHIGERSFVGNNAHLSVGKNLGDNCLLGVLSTAPQKYETTPENSEWLGAPSFALPYRKKVEDFDVSETFKPTLKLYFQRIIIDGLRILIPNFLALMGMSAFVAFIYFGYQSFGILKMLPLIPVVELSIVFLIAGSIALLKQMLMGTFKPVVKPLWCTYVWFNELVNGAYETIGAPLMSFLLGTPFFSHYLRLMGCKIGKHAYIGTSLFSEWDLVEVGDYAALNSGVVIQNHLFEDRVMKSSYLKIGDECSIGNLSVVLYDSEIKERTNVAPLSLVMKGDTLQKDSQWVGIPIVEA